MRRRNGGFKTRTVGHGGPQRVVVRRAMGGNGGARWAAMLGHGGCDRIGGRLIRARRNVGTRRRSPPPLAMRACDNDGEGSIWVALERADESPGAIIM